MGEPGPSTAKRLKLSYDSSSGYTVSDTINFSDLSFYLASLPQCIQFCQHFGLLPKSVNCVKCDNEFKEISVIPNRSSQTDSKLIFRCYKKNCGSSVTPKKNTWFSQSHISIKKSLFLTYCWVQKYSYEASIKETSGPHFENKITSTETVADIFSYCREVCLESLFNKDSRKKIGGPNLTVEIDESKFGKRKYNKGRVVEGQWVLGGICRETRDCFFVPVAERNAETLINIILEHVEVGSIIHTDEWRAYNSLSDHGFIHQTVNHSQNFVNPDTGVHTNLIESSWWSLKRALGPTHTRKDQFPQHFAEFIWRRQHKDERDLYIAFLNEIVKIYPGI